MLLKYCFRFYIYIKLLLYLCMIFLHTGEKHSVTQTEIWLLSGMEKTWIVFCFIHVYMPNLISLCRFWCLRIDLGSLRCLHPGSTGLSIVSKPSIDWAFMNAVLGGWMGCSNRDASRLAVVNMYIVCIYCVNTWLWFYLLFFHFICRNIHCNCILKH